MKLTGAAMLVSRGMKVLQAAPAAYPYRSATTMSFIEETVQRAIDTAAGSSGDFCITLECRGNSRNWLQITGDSINLAYPFADAPSARLPILGVAIPESFELNGWEPNSHVTFEHDSEAISEICAFAREYTSRVFVVHDDASQFTCEDIWL